MNKIIGIDLGTTNSCVAIMEAGKPVVIANADGMRTTPSVVAFAKDDQKLVGAIAKRQAVTNPENTVYSIKRFMGRRGSEVEREEKMVPFKVVGNVNDPVKVRIMDKHYTPPEISAMILQYMKKAAEDYLGQSVTDAVIFALKRGRYRWSSTTTGRKKNPVNLMSTGINRVRIRAIQSSEVVKC